MLFIHTLHALTYSLYILSSHKLELVIQFNHPFLFATFTNVNQTLLSNKKKCFIPSIIHFYSKDLRFLRYVWFVFLVFFFLQVAIHFQCTTFSVFYLFFRTWFELNNTFIWLLWSFCFHENYKTRKE